MAAFHVLLGYALIIGFGYDVVREASENIKLFDVFDMPPPPPPPEPTKAEAEKQKAKAEKPEGAASPKNLRDTPSPVVAPPPVIELEVPSPIVAAPIAGLGFRDSAGASDVPGPGTGSGGQGTGTGSGDAGNGTGGGGGGGAARRARWIKGRIDDSDKPKAAYEANAVGTVYMRFIIGTTGRVTGCTVTRSSGWADLDQTTCRLIEQRFRYKPARDANGKRVAQVHPGEHEWYISERRDWPPAANKSDDFGDDADRPD